jgi:hypothetical protein
MEIAQANECNCNICPGKLYCRSAYGKIAVIKDQDGKPSWYVQKSMNPNISTWEKITK